MLELIILGRKLDWILQLHSAILAHEKLIGQIGCGKQPLQSELIVFSDLSCNMVVVREEGGFGVVRIVLQ